MFKKIKIHSDYMSVTYDTTEFEYNNATPDIKMQIYSAFCAPGRSYAVPFCTKHFNLSNEIRVQPLLDENKYIASCKVVRLSDTSGVLVFSTTSRIQDNVERVILEISDKRNGVQAHFTVAKGYDLCNTFSCEIIVDQNTGILSCHALAAGLPWATRRYWYVAEPEITFFDDNNATLDVTLIPNLNIFDQAVLCRSNTTYEYHNFTAILNQSLYGKLTCNWRDKIGGGSATKTIDINYTK